jgi:VWFA-related protein
MLVGERKRVMLNRNLRSRRNLLLCAAALAAAQPIYRTGSQLVEVDVVVHNDKGPVKGLTKDDFTIQDKGKPQTIAVFAMTERGSTAGNTAPLPPGVSSNRLNAHGESTQTATVILFDRLNMLEATSSSSSKQSSSSSSSGPGLSGASATARRQLLELLSTMGAPEKVGLYSLYKDLTVVRDFNEDAAPLVDAAKRLSAPSPQASGGTPEEQAMETTLRGALTPGQSMENTARAEITAAAFRSIARRMEGIQGRKSLIWIASSFPLTYGTSTDRRSNDEAEVANIANILSEANIALYSIDPRGAGTFNSQPTSANSNNNAQEGRVSASARGKGGLSQVDNLSQSASSLSGTQAMEMIADQTGGKAYINLNEIAGPIREAMASTEVDYTLGFYVDDKALDGKKHELSVKVAKKPETAGAKVLFRKSYLAVAKPEHPQMGELVADRLDAGGVGVMAVALSDPNKPGIDAVQVRVDIKDLQFERRVDKWAAAFDLALAIETGAGEPKTVVSPTNLSLTDDQLRKGLTAGLIVDNTIPAPDKAATLRVVVQDKSTGAAGSVRVPLPAK